MAEENPSSLLEILHQASAAADKKAGRKPDATEPNTARSKSTMNDERSAGGRSEKTGSTGMRSGRRRRRVCRLMDLCVADNQLGWLAGWSGPPSHTSSLYPPINSNHPYSTLCHSQPTLSHPINPPSTHPYSTLFPPYQPTLILPFSHPQTTHNPPLPLPGPSLSDNRTRLGEVHHVQ